MKNQDVHLDPNEEHPEEPIEPEVIEKPKALAKPGTPISADELALLEEGRGEKVILQRAQILATARGASLRATLVTDWTLFKTETGQVYGFLADQGCQRGAKRIWGIQLSNYGPLANNPYYEERGNPDSDDYSVRLTADGYCELTKEHFFTIEGYGYVDNQDAQQAKGQRRKDIVANHARRNLEGKVTRRAAGLEAVPLEEIQKHWEGTGRDVGKCAKGRGFGTGSERVGGASEKHDIDAADIPNCPACEKTGLKVRLMFRQGKDGRDSFFGCPNYEKHPKEKVIINVSKLKAEIEARKQQTPRQPGDEGE